MRKKICLLLMCFLGLLNSCSEDPHKIYFKKLFADLKEKNTDDLVNHFIAEKQLDTLLTVNRNITQKILDSVPIPSDGTYRSVIKQVFLFLFKKADSLHIDLSHAEYKDCKFEVFKDSKSLCTSLRGMIYFTSNRNDYVWVVNDALLIRGEWRIIDPGKLIKGDDAKFLPIRPDKISPLGTFSKFKISVKLEEPPPDTHKPPPPPPPDEEYPDK